MILLDTNVFIRLLKGDAPAGDWPKRIPRNEPGVSTIVLMNLSTRLPRSRNILRSGMQQIEYVPFDRLAALEAAKIRIQLERKCRTIGLWIC